MTTLARPAAVLARQEWLRGASSRHRTNPRAIRRAPQVALDPVDPRPQEPGRKAPQSDEVQQLKVRSVQRVEPVDAEAKHDDMARPDKAPVNLRAGEDLRGVWQKIENIGPLAQLNALCYGRRSGEIVYQDRYRLKCSNNQIIEAWRRKSGR